MGLFNFKKKEDNPSTLDAPEANSGKAAERSGSIKVLGTGCAKCDALEKNVSEALSEIGSQAKVVKVTDFMEIAKYGVMRTPALVIDEQVVSVGQTLSTEEVVTLLKEKGITA